MNTVFTATPDYGIYKANRDGVKLIVLVRNKDNFIAISTDYECYDIGRIIDNYQRVIDAIQFSESDDSLTDVVYFGSFSKEMNAELEYPSK